MVVSFGFCVLSGVDGISETAGVTNGFSVLSGPAVFPGSVGDGETVGFGNSCSSI